jgi:predicted ferric reductase
VLSRRAPSASTAVPPSTPVNDALASAQCDPYLAADRYLFLAGGIGITPLIGTVQCRKQPTHQRSEND